jgi:hypothetical protein
MVEKIVFLNLYFYKVCYDNNPVAKVYCPFIITRHNGRLSA